MMQDLSFQRQLARVLPVSYRCVPPLHVEGPMVNALWQRNRSGIFLFFFRRCKAFTYWVYVLHFVTVAALSSGSMLSLGQIASLSSLAFASSLLFAQLRALLEYDLLPFPIRIYAGEREQEINPVAFLFLADTYIRLLAFLSQVLFETESKSISCPTTPDSR